MFATLAIAAFIVTVAATILAFIDRRRRRTYALTAGVAGIFWLLLRMQAGG